MTTTTYGFNWSWVDSTSTTKRESDVVYQGGGTIYSFRQPSGGAISSSDISAFSKSIGQNLQKVRSDWRTYIRPVLNSLPAGNSDTRWSTAIGKGLPSKIDCFAYGVQGTTLFVFNDATSSKADGRYWESTEYRPKTIAEAFEDVYTAIAAVETTATSTASVDLDPLWAAIGEAYRNTDRATSVGSLDTRVGTLETYISQLNDDIYEPTTYPYQIGTPLPYSIANMLNQLLQLHNSGGWGSDPSDVNHTGVPAGAHTHPFTEVLPPPAPALTQSRSGSYTTLNNEVLRLRWEIQRTRGSSSWYTDVSYPYGGTASLSGHISAVGSGTPSSTNPHGLTYVNLGIDTYLDAIISFTGMSSYTDSNPTYSSTYYVTQSTSLQTAISDLDAAINAALGTAVVRMDYGPYDRSGLSETDRLQTPITITHSFNRKPVVNVIDTSDTVSYYMGMYTSPTYDVEIDYPDSNTFRIWTDAAVVEIIAFF
jgi:hypothetical protein